MSKIEDWSIAVAGLGPSGAAILHESGEEERAGLTEQLGIVGCTRLVVEVAITPGAKGRYHVTGRITGELVQACVVTLDPVTQVLDEPIDMEFWPEEQIPEAQGETERSILDGPEIEPIRGGVIDLGRVTVEIIGTALDPYPRLTDAELEKSESPATGTKGGPFAALAGWKKGQRPE